MFCRRYVGYILVSKSLIVDINSIVSSVNASHRFTLEDGTNNEIALSDLFLNRLILGSV